VSRRSPFIARRALPSAMTDSAVTGSSSLACGQRQDRLEAHSREVSDPSRARCAYSAKARILRGSYTDADVFGTQFVA